MGLAAMFCCGLGTDSERGSEGEIESGRNTQTTDIPLPVTVSGPLRATLQARQSTQSTMHLRICKGMVRSGESDGSVLGHTVSLLFLLCRMEVIAPFHRMVRINKIMRHFSLMSGIALL